MSRLTAAMFQRFADPAAERRYRMELRTSHTRFFRVLLLIASCFDILQGASAVANDDLYAQGSEYLYRFDMTTWGWIHLILGVIAVFAGAALFSGKVWARTVAVIVAAVSIIVNFTWLPYYPLWSILIIAFDVFVIWALTAHGRDITVD